MTTGSIADNGEVGLWFIDFEGQRRMRLNGVATLHFDAPLMSEYPEAQFMVLVRAREVFVNCPRYLHEMELVERSRYVPKAEVETPIPTESRTSWSVAPATCCERTTQPATPIDRRTQVVCAPESKGSRGRSQGTMSMVDFIKSNLDFARRALTDAANGTDEQLHFIPSHGSHSIAWCLWHTARVEDLLMNAVIGGGAPSWNDKWAQRTGLPGEGIGTSMSDDDA